MIFKIYTLIWILGILTAAAFYLTGNFPIMTVVLGFLTLGTVFMRVLGVLPKTVVHRSATKH